MKIRRHEAEVLRNKPNTEATEAQRAQRVRRNGHGGTESEAQRGQRNRSIERAKNIRGRKDVASGLHAAAMRWAGTIRTRWRM